MSQGFHQTKLAQKFYDVILGGIKFFIFSGLFLFRKFLFRYLKLSLKVVGHGLMEKKKLFHSTKFLSFSFLTEKKKSINKNCFYVALMHTLQTAGEACFINYAVVWVDERLSFFSTLHVHRGRWTLWTGEKICDIYFFFVWWVKKEIRNCIDVWYTYCKVEKYINNSHAQ